MPADRPVPPATTARRHRLPLLWLALALAGCAEQRPALETTAEEQDLLRRLTVDHSVIIDTLERDKDKRLLISTRQGSTHVRYRLVPSERDPNVLTIKRVQDEYRIPVADSGQRGTGPERRGLDR